MPRRLFALRGQRQRMEDLGAQVRPVSSKRIGDFDARVGSSFGIEVKGLEVCGTNEGIAQRLHEPALGECGRNGPAMCLLGREAGLLNGRGRQVNRNLVIANKPGNLLDEVRGHREVRAPRRRGDTESAVTIAIHLAPDVSQDCCDALG